MSIKAFVDNGYPEGSEFLTQFLSSPDFSDNTLKKLSSLSNRFNKRQKALEIIDLLDKGELSKEEIMLAYVKQPKVWLSLKQKQIMIETPRLQEPLQLLKKFGENGWYGPIRDINGSKIWYIHIYKIPDVISRGVAQTTQIDERNIRWSVIAEINTNYLALSWNNFSYIDSANLDENHDNRSQFPFWKYIPALFDELANHCKSPWTDINLHELVLTQLWDGYLSHNDYQWRHLRIRAEASGVALNAHSAGITEINVGGLEALSTQLVKSSLEAMGISINTKNLHDVENALLRTLIKEWGTKSYEFSLERKALSDESSLSTNQTKIESESQTEIKKRFKAHCYFGLKPKSNTQDLLQHLNCCPKFGGSTGALNFLLHELGL